MLVAAGLKDGPRAHAADAAAATGSAVVTVGGYPFEPFVEGDAGITPAFIALLNERQSDYEFRFLPVPARRRYELLDRAVIDAVFFEMPAWGWRETHADRIEVTAPILRGAELFVALEGSPLGDQLFELSPHRSVALTLGYHYAFADFNADQAHIRSLVTATFAERVSQTLRYLETGTVEVGVLSNIFLLREFQRRPALKGRLKVADHIDHEYALPLMVRRGGPVPRDTLAAMLRAMTADGSLKAFFKGYGLEDIVIDRR